MRFPITKLADVTCRITMSINKLFYRFFGIVTIVALLSVSLYAQDKAVPTQYASYLNAVNAPYAWNMGYTGQGVVVGVIDDSIDMDHPFFNYNNVSSIDASLAYNTGAMYNFIRDPRYIPDFPTQSETNTSAVWDNGTVNRTNGSSFSVVGDYHGTSVTGCIAAYDPSSKTYGPAYNATLVPIRVDFHCQAFYATIDGWDLGTVTFARAVAYKNNVIDIKNNSYGTSQGYEGSEAELTMLSIDSARENNTFLLYSAGNERNKTNDYPNNKDCTKRITNSHPYTITVAATGKNWSRDYTGFAPFSNYGSCVFITAPGVGIPTADREDVATNNVFAYVYDYESTTSSAVQGNYSGIRSDSFSGTSASCPVASGVLALALEAYKETCPDQVCDVRYIKQLLARTSTKIDQSATAPEVKWVTNNAGISFSHSYGFGQINAQGLIDAILDPESTLGDNYDTVTQQTVATFDWSDLSASSDEYLVFFGTYSSGGNSGGSAHMTTFGISEQEVIAAAAEYQSGSAAYVTPNDFELMAANEPFYSDTITLDDDSFLSSGILKQDMEEVVVTLTATADNTTTGFDPRYMQITLDHNGVTSYLAFADPNSPQENMNTLTWSFSSNAFWGEDPTGEWTLSVYNMGTNDTFSISDVFSTFYMGELKSTPDPTAAVPEPATWALMALGVVVLFLRRRVRSEE